MIFWCVERWGSGISAWFLFVITTIQCVSAVLLTQENIELYTWSIVYSELYSNPPLVLYRAGKHYWFIPICTQDYVILATYKKYLRIEYFTIGVIWLLMYYLYWSPAHFWLLGTPTCLFWKYHLAGDVLDHLREESPKITRADVMAKAKLAACWSTKVDSYSGREWSPKTLPRSPDTLLSGHSLTHSSLLNHTNV